MTGLTEASFVAMAPLIVLALGSVWLMLQIAVKRTMTSAYLVTLASILLSLASVPWAREAGALDVTPLLRADDYALFFSALFLLCAAVTTVISRDYLELRPGENEEFFLLLMLSTLGAMTLAYATHLVSLLLGLELLGVALYALIAYPDKGSLPLEAAIKYLVLSGAASAIFLFGFALIYAVGGSLAYDDIGTALQSVSQSARPLLATGAVLVIAGLGFKLSAVPFHMWTPDVYEGAPAPVSGFLAAVDVGVQTVHAETGGDARPASSQCEHHAASGIHTVHGDGGLVEFDGLSGKVDPGLG